MRIVCVCLVALSLVGCELATSRRDVIAMRGALVTTWTSSFERPLRDKLSAAPGYLIDYIRADNKLQGYVNEPRAAELTPELVAAFQTAIDELPPEVARVANTKLAGIFPVHDLGGIGVTEPLYNADGGKRAAIIAFDVDLVRSRGANALFTWKENEPYEKDPASIVISATIEPATSDDFVHGLQFILLHELGHVLAVNHPYVAATEDWRSFSSSRFTATTWQAGDALPKSIFDSEFGARRHIRYYGPESLRLRRARVFEVYEAITKTSFVSPYAATNPEDDFAEAFASYVHVVLMKKPYELWASREAQAAAIRPCWDEKRCAQKRGLIETMLAGEL